MEGAFGMPRTGDGRSLVDAGRLWFCLVSIFCGACSSESPHSDDLPLSTVPLPPRYLLVVAADSGLLALAWPAPPEGAARLVLERSSRSDSTFVRVGTFAPEVGRYEDHAVEPNATYWYRIAAESDDVRSSYRTAKGLLCQKSLVLPIKTI